MTEKAAKPFLKWTGGKGRLLPEIRKQVPETVTRYVEPFVGGGAVLFDILSAKRPKEVLINDANQELICVYTTVRDNPEALIDCFGRIEQEFLSLNVGARKEYYGKKRDRFNKLACVPDTSLIEKKRP